MRGSTPLPRVLQGRRRVLLGGLVAVGVVQAVSAVATALLAGVAFTHLFVRPGGSGAATPDPDVAVRLVVVGLVLASLLSAGSRGVERVLAERVGQSYVHEVRGRLLRHVLRTETSRSPRSTGATVLRFTGDLGALRTWVSLGLARLAVAVPLLVGGVVALLVVSPVLGAVTGAVLALGAAGAWAQGPHLRRTAVEARRQRSRLAADVTERVAGASVVRAFGQERRERRRVLRHSQRLADAMIRRAGSAARLVTITELTAGGATVAVLTAGVLLGTSAELVATAMAMVAFLVTPVRDLGRLEEYRHNARVATDKLLEVLARPTVAAPPRSRAVRLATGPGLLELDDVSVAGRLAHISARAEPGTVVAVVGANGAGKSTLLDAAARLVVPDAGRVLLDGHDLSVLDPASLRTAIGVVGPDLPLLRGTVRRNLTYRCPGAPADETARVVALTGLDDVLAALPQGLSTRIGPGGAGLSSGQRQQLALARAVLGGPRLLLLDEPDANLDPAAALALDRVIATFPGAVLVVTHRPERLLAADVVWQLDGGRLVHVGSARDAFLLTPPSPPAPSRPRTGSRPEPRGDGRGRPGPGTR